MRESVYSPVPLFRSFLMGMQPRELDDRLAKLIGTACQNFRRDYHWSRRVFADAVGIPESRIRLFESGVFSVYLFACYLAKMLENNEISYLDEALNMTGDADDGEDTEE